MDDSLGTKLRKLREERGYSLEQVAKMIGMARNTVYGYEIDMREPSFATLRRLAFIYKVTTDYLLGVTNNRIFQADGLSERENLLLGDIVDYMKDMSDGNGRKL